MTRSGSAASGRHAPARCAVHSPFPLTSAGRKTEHMRSLVNVFGRPGADRHTITRSDDRWIEAQRESGSARFLVIDTRHCLADESPALLRLPRELLPDGWREWQAVFLGRADDVPLFALAPPAQDLPAFAAYGQLAELRPVAMQLSPADAALVAHARAVMHWHETHRFCG